MRDGSTRNTFEVFILDKYGNSYAELGFFMKSPGSWKYGGGRKTFYYQPDANRFWKWGNKNLAPLSKWEQKKIEKFFPEIKEKFGVFPYFGDKVNESQEFERGKDPRHAMNVGAINKLAKEWDEVQQSRGVGSMNLTKGEDLSQYENPNDLYLQIYISYMPNVSSDVRNAVGEHMTFKYFDGLPRVDQPNMYFKIKPEYRNLFIGAFNKKYPDWPLGYINEDGFDFTRGQIDPFDKMGIGTVNRLARGLDLAARNLNFSKPQLVGSPFSRDNYGSELAIRFRLYTSPDKAIEELHRMMGDLEVFEDAISIDEGRGLVLTVKNAREAIVKEAYKKAMGLREGMEFERGQDPKKAMNVGVRTFEIDGLGMQQDKEGTFPFTEADTHEILASPHLWIQDPFDVLLATKMLSTKEYPDAHKSYSLKYLAEGPGEYDYVLYHGDYYPIPNKKNRITENLEFERGKDPKASMGVGSKAKAIRIRDLMRWSSKLDDMMPMADKRAMEFLEWPLRSSRMVSTSVILEDEEEFEKRLDGIIRSKRPIIYRDKIFIPDKDKNGYYTGHYTPHDLNESVSFERGKDPKSILNIGKERIKKLLHKDILGFNTGWTPQEKHNAAYPLGKRIDEVYILGFAGEIDENEWVFNEYTGKLRDLCEEGEILDTRIDGDNTYLLIDTEVGKIVRGMLDTEGIYYYGDLDTAIRLGTHNVPRPERESMA